MWNRFQMSELELTDDNSTLVQVIALCRQATSHYLSQWPKSSIVYSELIAVFSTQMSCNVGGYNSVMNCTDVMADIVL